LAPWRVWLTQRGPAWNVWPAIDNTCSQVTLSVEFAVDSVRHRGGGVFDPLVRLDERPVADLNPTQVVAGQAVAALDPSERSGPVATSAKTSSPRLVPTSTPGTEAANRSPRPKTPTPSSLKPWPHKKHNTDATSVTPHRVWSWRSRVRSPPGGRGPAVHERGGLAPIGYALMTLLLAILFSAALRSSFRTGCSGWRLMTRTAK
jgi:hypothetical protein